MKTGETPPLIDWMRPLDSDGALHAILLSTYGLCLSDPPFFEQDFIPTTLGLGGVRDRGYSSPASVERKLGQIYCGLVCDAHALAQGGRPSLRVDVIPVGRQLHHAKIALIHRERLVRLVIASANLTHEGFRRNREAAAVLDFHEHSDLSPNILSDFANQWLARIGSGVTRDFRNALAEAVAAAQGWTPTRSNAQTVRPLWGGGEIPLWKQLVEAWPQGELLREWLVCSPFWPSPGDSDTPFDVLQRELDARGANVAAATLKVLAPADAPGLKGRPCFPFSLIQQLTARGFHPSAATICPVRLDALDSEVPDGKAEDQRPLHAKWIFLRGDHTALLLLGSANFTRRGLGVLRHPEDANIEVCVLLSGGPDAISPENILPPLADLGIVDWNDCRAEDIATPAVDVEIEPWPSFINSIELEVAWETLPLVGTLRVSCSGPDNFDLEWETGDDVHPLSFGEIYSDGNRLTPVSAAQISGLLVHRRVVVRWDEPARQTFFPINIASGSKPGLPAVLGQDPTEQDLLAYFHGRIDEEDLMNLLIERARQKEAGQPVAFTPPDRELQNYVVREFIEGLYGMEDLLRNSASSPRCFEQALLGEFSPVRLANETQKAFAARRRTPTAAAFQLMELLRLVENLDPNPHVRGKPPVWIEEMRTRAMGQLFGIIRGAAMRLDFRQSCTAEPFRALATAVLKPTTANRLWDAIKAGERKA